MECCTDQVSPEAGRQLEEEGSAVVRTLDVAEAVKRYLIVRRVHPETVPDLLTQPSIRQHEVMAAVRVPHRLNLDGSEKRYVQIKSENNVMIHVDDGEMEGELDSRIILTPF